MKCTESSQQTPHCNEDNHGWGEMANEKVPNEFPAERDLDCLPRRQTEARAEKIAGIHTHVRARFSDFFGGGGGGFESSEFSPSFLSSQQILHAVQRMFS